MSSLNISRKFLRTLFISTALAAGFTGCHQSNGDAATADKSSRAKTPIVAVTHVTRANLSREIVFDAEFRPFQDIDQHAHVAGFVQQMNADVGDRVTNGQLIAAIEIPEFKEELERAQAIKHRTEEDVKRAEEDARRAELDIARADAGLKRADAAYAEAHQTYDRFLAVSKTQPGLVAQQELDVAQSRERTAAAAVDEARAVQASARAGFSAAKATILAVRDGVLVATADIHRLEAKQTYTRITAPFAGMVTKRFSDVGDLVRGGLSPSAPAVPIVRLVSVDKLRLVFPVSASHVARVKPGATVEITVPNLGRKLTGTVSRIAGEVDAATRSMEAQVDVPNPDRELIPGMYANVALVLDRREKVLTVPQTALSRGNPRTVGRVNAAGAFEERAVKLGLETANLAEVLAGLAENDLVIIGGRGQLKPGQKVETKLVELPTAN